jgi:hypothetical protein
MVLKPSDFEKLNPIPKPERLRAPLTYMDYCTRLGLDPESPATNEKYRLYYLGFRGN